jgi:hypothetical protein
MPCCGYALGRHCLHLSVSHTRVTTWSLPCDVCQQDDELGDLEEDGQAAAAARGAADISAFSSVLDEFLREKVGDTSQGATSNAAPQ